MEGRTVCCEVQCSASQRERRLSNLPVSGRKMSQISKHVGQSPCRPNNRGMLLLLLLLLLLPPTGCRDDEPALAARLRFALLSSTGRETLKLLGLLLQEQRPSSFFDRQPNLSSVPLRPTPPGVSVNSCENKDVPDVYRTHDRVTAKTTTTTKTKP